MSFRKRNVIVAQPGSLATNSDSSTTKQIAPLGVRPSPLDGRLTTSTGTRSLDYLLAGHSGLVLGTSLMVEESGTTDFGGALLRYYAAEGVVQDHHVHVLGMNEAWGRELPGLSGVDGTKKPKEARKGGEDKMKIAWRYERLGEFGAGSRGERSFAVLVVIYSFIHLLTPFDEQKEVYLTQQDHLVLVLLQPSVMTLISANV
jgi:elongator complex protein 4